MTTAERKLAKILAAGRRGGKARTPEKQAAARRNGLLGGRPKRGHRG